MKSERLLILLLLMAVASFANCTATRTANEIPFAAPRGDVILIANQKSGSVTMIEVGSGRIVAHLPVGAGPHEIAVSADGRTAVVPLFGESFLRGAGHGTTAAVIDIDSASVRRTIDLGVNTSPHGVVFLTDDRTAAVTSADAKAVVLIDTETGSLVRVIETGDPPYLLTRSRDGQFAFATNPQTDSISELNLSSQTPARKFGVSGNPGGIAVAADGKNLWIARTEDDALSVLDLETGEIVKNFEGVDVMRRIAVSPDGRTVLVTSHAFREVRLYDALEKEETGKIYLGADAAPSGVTFGADSETAYVTSPATNSILEIDLKNRRVTREFATESSPDGIVYVGRAAR